MPCPQVSGPQTYSAASGDLRPHSNPSPNTAGDSEAKIHITLLCQTIIITSYCSSYSATCDCQPQLLFGIGLVFLRALNNKHFTQKDLRSQTHSYGINKITPRWTSIKKINNRTNQPIPKTDFCTGTGLTLE